MAMAPSSSPSRPMKLLKSDLKPKLKANSGPITPLANSAATSSTAATAPPKKKTRDLPNFSDCHGCNRRINRDNPKNHLQALDSVWRILLLCRKCRKSIHSGGTCSYCFRETGNSGDLFQCRVCERKIHKNCVRDYGDCSPWCYLGVGVKGCGVCVDCWVPDLLKKTFRDSERTGNKRGRKKKSEGKRLSEKGLKNAECDSEKAKMGRIVKKQKLNGTKLMKNAVDLGNEKDGTKADNLNGNYTDASSSDGVLSSKSLGKDSDEGQRLVSSPNNTNWLNKVNEVLKGINTDKGNGSVRCNQGLLSYKRRRNTCQLSSSSDINCLSKDFDRQQMELCYKRDKARKIWSLNEEELLLSEVNHQKDLLDAHVDDTMIGGGVKSISDASRGPIDVNVNQINPCTNVDRFGQELVYRRTKFKGKVGTVKGPVDVQEGSSGINGPRGDVSGANLGLLTYKRSGKKKKQQLYDGNTLASDVDQQNSKFDVHYDARFIKSVQISGDIPEVSPDVISDKTTTHPCINVDESGQKVISLTSEQVCVADLSEGSFDANADQSNLFTNINRFGQEILCYERCRFGRKLFEVNGLGDASEGSNDVNGSCNNISGLNRPILTYERNRNRKIWPLNESELEESFLKPASSR